MSLPCFGLTANWYQIVRFTPLKPPVAFGTALQGSRSSSAVPQPSLLLLRGRAVLRLRPESAAVTEVHSAGPPALPWLLGAASHSGGLGFVFHVCLQNSGQSQRELFKKFKLKTSPCSSVCSVGAVERWAVFLSCF